MSSFVGGIPQLVEDGKTGVFYPYNEPHTLAFLLMNIHNDKEKLIQLSSNEIEVARKRHDDLSIYNQFAKVYNDILNN